MERYKHGTQRSYEVSLKVHAATLLVDLDGFPSGFDDLVVCGPLLGFAGTSMCASTHGHRLRK